MRRIWLHAMKLKDPRQQSSACIGFGLYSIYLHNSLINKSGQGGGVPVVSASQEAETRAWLDPEIQGQLEQHPNPGSSRGARL